MWKNVKWHGSVLMHCDKVKLVCVQWSVWAQVRFCSNRALTGEGALRGYNFAGKILLFRLVTKFPRRSFLRNLGGGGDLSAVRTQCDYLGISLY